MEIKSGDKFVAKKSCSFLNEGEIVMVTNVNAQKNDGEKIVSFVFGEEFENNGLMSIGWFNERFEKIEEEYEDDCDITMELVEEIMGNSCIEAKTVFGNCAVVSCRLPNGFVITETSSCANHEHYDEDVNFNICLDKIAERIYEFESYRFLWYRYENSDCDCEDRSCCECCNGNDCNEQ